MDAMEALRPDFYQTLCDSETDALSSKKRLQRSVKSTGEYFEYCMDRHKNSKVEFCERIVLSFIIHLMLGPRVK